MTHYQLNTPDVIQDVIDGEALIVQTRTGCYYSLLGSGVRVWEALLEGCSVDQIADLFRLDEGVSVQGIKEQIQTFIAGLREEQLIRPSTQPEDKAAANPNSIEFSTPSIQKFTDMQELLLVDPIHEVRPDAGWPIKPDDV